MNPEWPLILFTFFLCVSGGVLGVQGLLCVLGKGKKMQLPSLVVSLAALAVGGIAVFMHLQHWERIFNGFGHITSGITLEFIGCIVFFVVLVLYFLFMRRSEDGMAPKWCGVLAIVAGLGLPALTGDSYLMHALPSWDTPLLIVYYLVNAVFMGGLASLIIAGVVGDDDASGLVTKAALAGGVLQLVGRAGVRADHQRVGGFVFGRDPVLLRPDAARRGHGRPRRHRGQHHCGRSGRAVSGWVPSRWVWSCRRRWHGSRCARRRRARSLRGTRAWPLRAAPWAASCGASSFTWWRSACSRCTRRVEAGRVVRRAPRSAADGGWRVRVVRRPFRSRSVCSSGLTRAVRLVAGSVLVGAFGCWHSAAQRSARFVQPPCAFAERHASRPPVRVERGEGGRRGGASASAARPQEGRRSRARFENA